MYLLNRAALVAGLLACSPVFAASVDTIQGNVSINRGEGFRKISGPTEGKPGDTVMAGQGGSVDIVYDNGCRVKVEHGSVVAIAAEPPCMASVEYPDQSLLLGGLVVAGAVAAVIVLSNDDDSSPASP